MAVLRRARPLAHAPLDLDRVVKHWSLGDRCRTPVGEGEIDAFAHFDGRWLAFVKLPGFQRTTIPVDELKPAVARTFLRRRR